MIYEYDCKHCSNNFDVPKSYKEMEKIENCPDCGKIADRVKFSRTTYLCNTSVENAEYNPGLGAVVKNKKHRAELAKQKGLVEVGNDYKSGEANQKHFDDKRSAKREKGWADVAKFLRDNSKNPKLTQELINAATDICNVKCHCDSCTGNPMITDCSDMGRAELRKTLKKLNECERI